MSNKQYYYDSKATGGGYIGRIYHYDDSGNKEIVVHRTDIQANSNQAIDMAIEWADENNIEAQDGT